MNGLLERDGVRLRRLTLRVIALQTL